MPSDTLPSLDTDRQYISIAIANLLDNALKYASKGSIVRIFVRLRVDAQQSGIEIGIENQLGSAGIPAADKVFQKYYRSAGAHAQTGSGLGLYLVHSMSELLGARVRYVPSDNLVRFELWLPL
jgi:signal transduction histidine kinase